MREVQVGTLLMACALLSGCAQHDTFRPSSISSGLAASHVLSKPPMPGLCQFRGSGFYRTAVTIDEFGDVIEARTESGSVDGRQTVQDWVHQWKFRPFEQEGKAVAMQTTVAFDIACGA